MPCPCSCHLNSSWKLQYGFMKLCSLAVPLACFVSTSDFVQIFQLIMNTLCMGSLAREHKCVRRKLNAFLKRVVRRRLPLPPVYLKLAGIKPLHKSPDVQAKTDCCGYLSSDNSACLRQREHGLPFSYFLNQAVKPFESMLEGCRSIAHSFLFKEVMDCIADTV